MFDVRLTAIETKLAVVEALLGVNIALTLGVLWIACTIMGRLPR